MGIDKLALSRFFSTGPAVVVAFDHGMMDGPIDGVAHVAEIPKRILPDIDAVLLSNGMLQDIGKELCGRRNSPLAITRINWSTIYCFGWGYHSGDTVKIASPKDALRAGADMVLISLSLQTSDQKLDAKNIELFAQLCNEAHDLGMPVVGEYFPVNDENMSPEVKHEEIKTGCRILYELGANVIKTFYTNRFKEVVAGCPTPILALGGKKLPTDLDALIYAKRQIDDGAAGIVFGRNVIQSKKPLELQRALLAVLKDGRSPEAVAKEYALT
jgi:DhnA family fructose-bisphosphate aldolase class Ia